MTSVPQIPYLHLEVKQNLGKVALSESATTQLASTIVISFTIFLCFFRNPFGLAIVLTSIRWVDVIFQFPTLQGWSLISEEQNEHFVWFYCYRRRPPAKAIQFLYQLVTSAYLWWTIHNYILIILELKIWKE